MLHQRATSKLAELKATYEAKTEQHKQQLQAAGSSATTASGDQAAPSEMAIEAARQQERSVCDMRWRARHSMLERRIEGQRDQISQLKTKVVALGGTDDTTTVASSSVPSTPSTDVAPELPTPSTTTETNKRPLPMDEDVEMKDVPAGSVDGQAKETAVEEGAAPVPSSTAST